MPLSPARLSRTTRSILTMWLRCTRTKRSVSSRASTSPIGERAEQLWRSRRRYRCSARWRGPRRRPRPRRNACRRRARSADGAQSAAAARRRRRAAHSCRGRVRAARRCRGRSGARGVRRPACGRLGGLVRGVRSGTRNRRNMPETQNATIATTIASRSVESAGAVDAAARVRKHRDPCHRGVVHARHRNAERDRRQDQRRPSAAAGREPQREPATPRSRPPCWRPHRAARGSCVRSRAARSCRCSAS